MIELTLVEQFAFILFVHLVYDFHWQGEYIGTYKAKYFFILFVHALTWALFIGFSLKLFALYTLWKFLFLFITHLLIDLWKVTFNNERHYIRYLLIDQGLHLITLIAVFLL